MRLLTLAPLVYLGRISYGLYVFHNFCYGVDGWLGETWPWSKAIPGPVLVSPSSWACRCCRGTCSRGPINRLKDRFPYRRDFTPRSEPAVAPP